MPVPSPTAILAAVLLWLSSIAGACWWYGGLREASVVAGYEKRDNVDLRKATARIQQLEAEKSANEHHQAATLAEIGKKHEDDLAGAEERRKRDVAAARAGAVRLRDPGGQACPAEQRVPDAPAGAGERDARAVAELSRTATEFLLELANDADDVARQLGSCQAVVRTFETTGATP